MSLEKRMQKYGYMNSPETRKKISEGMIGNQNWKYKKN